MKSCPSVYIGEQRCGARSVTEVVVEPTLGERRARRRLDRDEAHRRVLHERQRQPAEVRATATRRDDDVGQPFTRERELLLGLEADHRLMEQHVVQH